MALVDQRALSGLTEPRAVAGALVDLYRQNGSSLYDDVVSQTEPALQCGSAAHDAGAPGSTVVAAFLHDPRSRPVDSRLAGPGPTLTKAVGFGPTGIRGKP